MTSRHTSRVAFFSLPIPSAYAGAIKAKGVDTIACLSVSDAETLLGRL